MYKKGQIIWGKVRDGDKTKAFHPIVFIREHNELFFEGAMLTHSSMGGNVRLKTTHYRLDTNDERPQYLVNNYLLKKNEWGPFEEIGRLTKSGLRFLDKQLADSEPIFWEDYIDL